MLQPQMFNKLERDPDVKCHTHNEGDHVPFWYWDVTPSEATHYGSNSYDDPTTSYAKILRYWISSSFSLICIPLRIKRRRCVRNVPPLHSFSLRGCFLS